MTLSATPVPRNEYVGSGSTGPFTYSFRITNKNHLLVLRTVIATGVTTTLVVDTDYSVAGVDSATGSITLTTALEATERLTILRLQTLEQASEYTNEDFPAGRLEKDLDKIVMALQELNERTLRAFLFKKESQLENVPIDDPTDGKFMKYDSALGKFVWATPAGTTISSPVGIGDGGTGATTAEDALANIGAAAATHKDEHKSGGADAFASGDLLEAVIKRIRQTGSPSAGATTDLLVGAIADLQFLRRSGTGVVGSYGFGARILGADGKNNAGTPNTQYDLDAEEVQLRDANGTSYWVAGSAITNNISTAGPAVNGRDQAGAFTDPSFIHFFYIYNPATDTLATLSSASLTPAALPSGYTHWAYFTSVYFTGGALRKARTKGSMVHHEGRQTALNGGSATTETSVNVATFVPANALSFTVFTRPQIASDGNGALNATYKVYSITAVMLYEVFIRTPTNDGAGGYTFNGNNVQLLLPNIGQAFFYDWDITLGGSPSLTIDVSAYKIPNGGE